jgi:hypothetical protein
MFFITSMIVQRPYINPASHQADHMFRSPAFPIPYRHSVVGISRHFFIPQGSSEAAVFFPVRRKDFAGKRMRLGVFDCQGSTPFAAPLTISATFGKIPAASTADTTQRISVIVRLPKMTNFIDALSILPFARKWQSNESVDYRNSPCH